MFRQSTAGLACLDHNVVLQLVASFPGGSGVRSAYRDQESHSG